MQSATSTSTCLSLCGNKARSTNTSKHLFMVKACNLPLPFSCLLMNNYNVCNYKHWWFIQHFFSSRLVSLCFVPKNKYCAKEFISNTSITPMSQNFLNKKPISLPLLSSDQRLHQKLTTHTPIVDDCDHELG
jgi:hypothetical protein